MENVCWSHLLLKHLGSWLMRQGCSCLHTAWHLLQLTAWSRAVVITKEADRDTSGGQDHQILSGDRLSLEEGEGQSSYLCVLHASPSSFPYSLSPCNQSACLPLRLAAMRLDSWVPGWPWDPVIDDAWTPPCCRYGCRCFCCHCCWVAQSVHMGHQLLAEFGNERNLLDGVTGWWPQIAAATVHLKLLALFSNFPSVLCIDVTWCT